MKVNIYLETDKQCQACIQRKYGYVIEIMHHGQIVTREGSGKVKLNMRFPLDKKSPYNPASCPSGE